MMPRESPYPLVAIEVARQLITAQLSPLATEMIDIRHPAALDRVLAEDIVAAAAIPPAPRSAVDGYALRAADGLAPRQVIGEITAGGAQLPALQPGQAARIMTGGLVPPGADAVVMVEQTLEADLTLTLQRAAPRAGEAIHTIGQDLAAGEVVLRRGDTLTYAAIGLLATIGCVQVLVARRPRVAVLATGDEVYEPDADPGAGGVRDSNRYALLAAARAAGAETISLGIARDDLAVQRAAIQDGLARADVLITSGGVSMGTRDLIKPLLAELGTVHFGRVAFKPGKPTMFATVELPAGRRLVFGLPGYPVSSLVSFEVFVRPALRRLQGDRTPERPLARVQLCAPIMPSADRPEYQRAVVSFADGQLVARNTGAQGSSRLLSLRDANALLIVPAGIQRRESGEMLDALLTAPVREDTA